MIPTQAKRSQGILAVGPWRLNEQHILPWCGMNWFICIKEGVKYLRKKHLKRVKYTEPLWERN